MKIYPAKLLLFGEHTVNAGSQALAMPLPLFSGKWAYEPQLDHAELAARQMQLPQLADYLDRLHQQDELLAPIDVAAFRQALAEGLIFESNIPTGYGAGSSGALVAGIVSEFGIQASGFSGTSLAQQRRALAQMEAFFHGTSSGTDPLICFLQKTVLLGGPDGAQIVRQSGSGQWAMGYCHLFLLDTGMRRQATPFIEYFLEKMQDADFADRCQRELLPSVDAAISAFLSSDGDGVFEAVHRIGAFQLRNLETLVPPAFRPIWQQGLDGDLFKLKVCGAGGGGFLLGVARDFEAAQAAMPNFKLIKLDIF